MLRRLTLLLSVLSSVATAQVDVTVSDSAGQPIAAARAELWRTSTLLSARGTDSLGRVSFSAQEANGATDVLVRSIGYAPRRVPVSGTATAISVMLERLGQSLPAVTVAAVTEACPQREDASARELWERVVIRYREPSLEGRRSSLEQRQGTVDERDVGFFDGVELQLGSRMYTPLGVRGAHQTLARRRYVQPLEDGHSHELFGAWRYPAIEAELAGHFATAEFAAAHTFTVASRTTSTVTLRYCANDRRQDGLDGTLQVSERDGFVEARWRFWNPRRGAEAAGGAVTFASAPVTDSPLPLTATTGLFWRQLPSGKFVQRWQLFHEWILLSDGSASGEADRLAGICRPPENYVLCSVASLRGRGSSAMTSCNSMPYRCFDY